MATQMQQDTQVSATDIGSEQTLSDYEFEQNPAGKL